MEKKHNYNYNWGKRNNVKGLCFFCNEPKLPDNLLCSTHFFKMVATSTLKNRALWECIQEMFYAQEGRCYLTGRKLILGKNASLDHLLPTK